MNRFYRLLSVVMGLSLTLLCGGVFAQNLLTNGSFELDPNGTPYPNNGGADSRSGWRFFAVAGADGSATVSSAAATDGSVGIELVRFSTGLGDSALDKDTVAAREIIPKSMRTYKFLVDVKDGGFFGGSPIFAIGAQFADGSFNRGKAFDPSAAFETIGISVLSDNQGAMSTRMDVPDGSHSVLLDNVRAFDTTDSGNRVVNPGFENSASRILTWRTYSLNPGEMEFTLDADAHSGSRAVKIERTFASSGADNDAAMDLWDDPVAVVPGEIIQLSFWAKKVSGDEFMRVFPKVVQFDAAYQVVRQDYWFYDEPVEDAYRYFDHTVGMTADTRYVSVSFMVGNTSGADRHVGAYLVDDISVSHAQNAISNPSFEQFANEDPLQILANSKGWRFFAVGGASGSATARSAAATDGAVGIELVRDAVEGGDSALDRDDGQMRIPIPSDDRIYKFLVDVKDGGLYGGSDLFYIGSQILGGAGTSNVDNVFDPGEQFETVGVCAGSGTDGQGSVRMDFREGSANRSAFLDNVRMFDVQRKNRMVNGGFENSATRPLNWRTFSLNPGEMLFEMVNDAHSGSRALRIERTFDGEGNNDAAADLEPIRVVVIGGETLTLRFSAKKVSGDDDARPFVSLAQFDAGGAWLGGELQHNINTANPGTGAFETFSFVITTDPNTRFLNIGLRVGNAQGSDRHVGAYIFDDIEIIQNQAPAFNAAAIDPANPTEMDILRINTEGFTDGDSDGEGYLYQWKKNGSPISGATNPKLTSLSFDGGDTITCEVTACDGIEEGNTIETSPVTIQGTGVSDWMSY